MRLGLLGGSFDPIHHGHLIVARALREALGLDAVLLVPAAVQPLKRGRHGAAPEHRARMVELAVEGEPGLVADRIEIERGGPSYTVDTLRALRARAPETGWTLLVGSDAAAELPRWREATALPSLAEVILFARPGVPVPPLGYRVVPVPQLDLSATDIRARVRAGRSIRYLLPDRVAEYIALHRLYRQQEGSQAC
jgi:nicotinate-nucleotide adenylyltransferase